MVLTCRQVFPFQMLNRPHLPIPARFQDLFTPYHGFFSPFGRPTIRYRTRGVFSLGGWLPPYSRRNSNRRYSGMGETPRNISPTGLSPSTAPDFHRSSGIDIAGKLPHPIPHISSELLRRIRFGLFPFRSPLLRKSHLISFPAGTEMLHFPAFPSLTGCGFPRELPFGDPRINGCMHLPAAFGSLPPPSSAPEPRHPPGGFLGYATLHPLIFNIRLPSLMYHKGGHYIILPISKIYKFLKIEKSQFF